MELKYSGYPVFLLTNSHALYTDLVMRATLGPTWRDAFDLILCNSRKPLFHRGESPFFEVDLERTILKVP
jgi:hypothetical protein